MRLIALSNTLVVNPESIDAIETGKGADKKSTLVYVGGKTFTTQVPPRQLLQAIEFASENKWENFFAG